MYTQRPTSNIHPGQARPSQDKYDRFEAWLRENGAQFDLVRSVDFGAVGGVMPEAVLLKSFTHLLYQFPCLCVSCVWV